jgi:excisionase family DNA binding protein
MQEQQKDFLPTEEAMRYLNTSRTKLLRLVKEGRLKQYKMALSNVIYYKRSELDAVTTFEVVEKPAVD